MGRRAVPTLTDDPNFLTACPVDDCMRDFVLPREHDQLRRHLRDDHTGQQFVATITRLRNELAATETLLRKALLARVAAKLRLVTGG